MLSYGADTFKFTAHVTRKLSAFWHTVQRWTPNCFLSTPTDIVAIEACLLPLDLLLSYKYRLACLRVICSPPETNSAAARLPPSVQTPSLHRHDPDHRALSRKNAASRLPLLWLQPMPPWQNRAHLPLDALPHSMLLILGPDGSAPHPVTSQHLLGEAYPAPPPPPRPHQPPASAPVHEPAIERVGGCRARPGKVRLPPLTEAPSGNGPVQIRHGSPTPDEVWQELPPRPPILGRHCSDHLSQLP